ncbi:MAG: hypothetical protein ABIG20_03030 [archaeon]
MAKDKASVEDEILKEAQAEAQLDEVKRATDAKRQSAAAEEEKAKPKAASKEEPAVKDKKEAKAKPQPKKKGTVVERAMDTISELKESKAAPKNVKPTRLKGTDHLYTIPLRNNAVRGKKARYTISMLKAFAKKHTKADKVVITKEVNEKIWERGRKKPPYQLRVVIGEDENGRAVIKLR